MSIEEINAETEQDALYEAQKHIQKNTGNLTCVNAEGIKISSHG